MLINSIAFVIFSCAVIFLYYLIPKKFRWIVLLLSSYVFYFISSKFLSTYLLLSTLSVYISGIFIDKENEKLENKKIEKKKALKKKKAIVTFSVLFNIGILLVLKYSNFFIVSFNSLFNTKYSLVKIILPLGISYYTLQAISYIVDVYRSKYKADRNFFHVSLFLSFFPIITEGPISRFNDLTPKLLEGHSIKYENIINGFALMLWGYFKKLVIADRCGIFVLDVFSGNYSGIVILFGIILYTVQIYFEFSGCMDIVNGLSKTMGIELTNNFERPFFSKSIQEFWRRWHITLGSWLKDYVFYPVSLSKASMKVNKFSRKRLGKNLSKVVPVMFSLFFVWFLNGMWHGASWKYVFYGLYYYFIMMIGLLLKPLGDKILSTLKVNTKSQLYKIFQTLRTTLFVLIGMNIFRASTVKSAFYVIGLIFRKSNTNLLMHGLTIIDFIVISVGIIILLIYGILEEKGIYVIDKLNKSNLLLRYFVYIMIIFMIIIFGIYGPGYNPSDFIYGQF